MKAKQVRINKSETGESYLKLESVNIVSYYYDKNRENSISISDIKDSVFYNFSDIKFICMCGELKFSGYASENCETIKAGTKVDIYLRF